MSKQLAKRASVEWADYVLNQFNEHLITEEEAYDLLQIKRAALYKLRKQWLKCKISKKPFRLYSSGQKQKRSLTEEIQNFLHQELTYIKKEAYYYRSKFNFAYLSEKIFNKFGLLIHRNTIRRFALKEGYYQQTPKEKKKPFYI